MLFWHLAVKASLLMCIAVAVGEVIYAGILSTLTKSVQRRYVASGTGPKGFGQTYYREFFILSQAPGSDVAMWCHMLLLLVTVGFQITNVVVSYDQVLPWVCFACWVGFFSKGIGKLPTLEKLIGKYENGATHFRSGETTGLTGEPDDQQQAVLLEQMDASLTMQTLLQVGTIGAIFADLLLAMSNTRFP